MLLISGSHTYNLSWGTLLQIYVSVYRCSIGNLMLCIATLLQMHMCIYVWLTCVVFISYRLSHSNRSIDVRLPNGSMSAPSKVVLMGPLSRSTINHLVYRELHLAFVLSLSRIVGLMLLCEHGLAPLKQERRCATPQWVNVSSFKAVLMGPLSGSTINHLVHRELQPSICAVSQLECWLHAPS